MAASKKYFKNSGVTLGISKSPTCFRCFKTPTNLLFFFQCSCSRSSKPLTVSRRRVNSSSFKGTKEGTISAILICSLVILNNRASDISSTAGRMLWLAHVFAKKSISSSTDIASRVVCGDIPSICSLTESNMKIERGRNGAKGGSASQIRSWKTARCHRTCASLVKFAMPSTSRCLSCVNADAGSYDWKLLCDWATLTLLRPFLMRSFSGSSFNPVSYASIASSYLFKRCNARPSREYPLAHCGFNRMTILASSNARV
mmetsp:Transcript_35654/g.63727  ORF Transcript_35654/g.63727 Transcript_35654/m.63727 type:complete len:258 (+) Transcript_35654:2399-3172(+)